MSVRCWRIPSLTLQAELRLEADLRTLRGMPRDQLLATAEQLLRANRSLGAILSSAGARIAELEAREALRNCRCSWWSWPRRERSGARR